MLIIVLGCVVVVFLMFLGLVYKPEGHPERKLDDEAQMKFLRELESEEKDVRSK